MFDFFKKAAADCHYTDGGSIYCPRRRGDVDVEHCFGCSRLVDMRDNGTILEIRCTGSVPAALAAR
jgi:hypothetical protein